MLEPLWNALHRWTAPKSAALPEKQPDGWDIPPTSEKAAAGPRGITLPWLPPYFDEQQTWGESAAMRMAYRRMLASPEVKSAFLGKALAVCALDLKIHHYGKKKGRSQRSKLADQELLRHQEIAEFVRWNLEERVGGGWAMVAWSILAGALVDGYSVNEKVWAREDQGEYQGAYVLDALKPKDTGKDVVLKTDEFRNVTSIMGLRFNGGQEFDPSAFLIFRHLPFWDMPTGFSDLRSAYASWHMIVTVKHLRAMGLDKRSLPMLVGHYTTQEQKVALNQTMALVRSQNWFAIPEGAKLEALNIAGMADAQFADAIKDLKHDVFLSIQGAILQALEGSTTDGRGNSQVHRSTADLFVWYLSSALAAVLNDRRHGLIPDLVSMNFEGVQGYPRASLSAVDVDELTKSLQVDTGLRQLGCDLSKDETYERYGRTPPEEPEDVLPGQQPPPGAGGGMPPGPGGNGQPQHPGGIVQTASGRHIRYEGGKRVPLAGFAEEDYDDFAEVFLPDAPPDFYGAEEDWSPGQGPRGGTFWVHNRSGRKVYSKSNPGAGSGYGAPHPAEQERSKTREEVASKKDVLGRDKGPRAATGEVREESRRKAKELLASKEKLTGAHVDELHGHLMNLSVDEIHALKKEGGVKASGRKHELAQKVADRLIGKLRGAQQTQRASELHGELASLAGQAKAPGTDPHVSREVGRLRKELDKVHNGEVPQERASAALEQIGKELAYVKERLGEPGEPASAPAKKGSKQAHEFTLAGLRAAREKVLEDAQSGRRNWTFGMAGMSGKRIPADVVRLDQRAQKEKNEPRRDELLRQIDDRLNDEFGPVKANEIAGVLNQLDERVGKAQERVNSLASDHRTAVEAAIKSGQKVPPEVLADYPDLQAKPSTGQQAPAPQNDQEATPETKDAVRTRLEGLLVAAKPALRAAGKQDVLDALIDHGKHVVASIGAKGTTNKAINRAVAAFEGAVARRTEGLAKVKATAPHEPRFPVNAETAKQRLADPVRPRPAFPVAINPPYKDNLSPNSISKEEREALPLIEVPTSSIYTTQSTIQPAKVEAIQQGKGKDASPPLAVATADGSVYLVDGNHRATVDVLAGKESIPLHVLHVNADGSKKHPFTGTDALGREWRNGELVAAKEEAPSETLARQEAKEGAKGQEKKESKVGGVKEKAKPVDPMAGHPLVGKSREEIVQTLTRDGSVDSPSTDPWGLRSRPAPAQTGAVLADVAEAVRKTKAANSFALPKIPDVWDKVHAQYPDLSLLDFQTILAQAHAGQQLRLRPFTLAPATLPRPEVAFPLDTEKKYYLDLGEKAPPSGTAAPGQPPASAPAKPAPRELHVNTAGQVRYTTSGQTSPQGYTSLGTDPATHQMALARLAAGAKGKDVIAEHGAKKEESGPRPEHLKGVRVGSDTERQIEAAMASGDLVKQSSDHSDASRWAMGPYTGSTAADVLRAWIAGGGKPPAGKAEKKRAEPKPPTPQEQERQAQLRKEVNEGAQQQRQTGKIAKQNHEMTQAEFLKHNGGLYGPKDRAIEAHRRMIIGALQRGEHVPAEVLADYPNLAESHRKKD